MKPAIDPLLLQNCARFLPFVLFELRALADKRVHSFSSGTYVNVPQPLVSTQALKQRLASFIFPRTRITSFESSRARIARFAKAAPVSFL